MLRQSSVFLIRTGNRQPSTTDACIMEYTTSNGILCKIKHTRKSARTVESENKSLSTISSFIFDNDCSVFIREKAFKTTVRGHEQHCQFF